MSILFIQYPRCTTCKKAKKWLEDNNVIFIDRNVIEHNPTAPELEKWIKLSHLPIKKFFNTSGLIYKEQGIKDKLPNMTEQEQFNLLATNGMLVKRPLLITEKGICAGFDEEVWKSLV